MHRVFPKVNTMRKTAIGKKRKNGIGKGRKCHTTLRSLKGVSQELRKHDSKSKVSTFRKKCVITLKKVCKAWWMTFILFILAIVAIGLTIYYGEDLKNRMDWQNGNIKINAPTRNHAMPYP